MRRLITTLLLGLATPATASDLLFKLVDDGGRPVADAVITVYPASGVPKGPISFPWPSAMVQQNISFQPHVLIVPVGATVRFPNKDNVRHHVYSFSKPARFDIKLFGKDETRSYTFTTAGAVALGCNIHDAMNGYIKVVDTPFAAKSDAAGMVRLTGLPTGGAKVTIWHALLRSKDNEIQVPVTLGASVAVTLSLRSGK